MRKWGPEGAISETGIRVRGRQGPSGEAVGVGGRMTAGVRGQGSEVTLSRTKNSKRRRKAGGKRRE